MKSLYSSLSFADFGIFIHDGAAGGNDMDFANFSILPDDNFIYVAGANYNKKKNYDMAVWALE